MDSLRDETVDLGSVGMVMSESVGEEDDFMRRRIVDGDSDGNGDGWFELGDVCGLSVFLSMFIGNLCTSTQYPVPSMYRYYLLY